MPKSGECLPATLSLLMDKWAQLPSLHNWRKETKSTLGNFRQIRDMFTGEIIRRFQEYFCPTVGKFNQLKAYFGTDKNSDSLLESENKPS